VKRLITILAAAALLGACAEGAKSGGPVATGPSEPPATSAPGPTTEPTTDPTTEPTTGGGTTEPTTSPDPTTPSGTVTLEVWFDAGDGSTLARVRRTLPGTQAVGTAALEALLEGPTDEEIADGIGTQIPPGTELIGISISDGVATVNLSQDYFSGGGAVSEWTRLGQVVWTITQFPTVDGVSIELDGDPVRPFDVDGNFLDRPWTREDFEFIAPPIVVDSPLSGATVTSPIEVTGTADVFEATVSYRLLDEGGRRIAQGFTNATCGTGCRGSFEVSVDYQVDQDQNGTLEVFEESAKDGRPTNVVSIPVTLTA
jgi:hypothetical protein